MTIQRKSNPSTGRRSVRGSFTQARRAAGFTLVELMIAMAIGLVLVAGLLMSLNSTLSSSRTNDRTSELQSTGRHSLNLIKQELRQAGFRGYTWPRPNPATTALGTVTGECGDGTGAFVSNVQQGVWGANDSNPFSGNCVPDKVGAAGGDVLTIRLMDGMPVATLVANTFYFKSTYAAGEVFRGATPPTTFPAGNPVASFALQTSVYHVLPYSVSATETPLVPALHRVALRSDGSMARELVSSGIEQLQVQYGRRESSIAPMQYFNAFTAANCPGCELGTNGTAPSTDTRETVWEEVNAVRIWVLARSSTPEPGYTNTSSYVMGDQTITVNDGFRRQLFSTVVQLRN